MKTNAKWWSPRLRQDVSVVRWGTGGRPVVLFPTAGGDAEECERFLMIKALEPLLGARRIRIYSCDAIGGRSLLDPGEKPTDKALAQKQFLAFVRHELVPAVRTDCNDPQALIMCAGASIGAYNALLALCSHPDVFDTAVCLSGTYDLSRFFQGFHSQDFHLVSPLHMLAYLGNSAHLALLQTRFVLLGTGEGKWEAPWESWQVANLLGKRGIPNRVDVWGRGYHHDWVTWREMLPKYLDELTMAAN